MGRDIPTRTDIASVSAAIRIGMMTRETHITNITTDVVKVVFPA